MKGTIQYRIGNLIFWKKNNETENVYNKMLSEKN